MKPSKPKLTPRIPKAVHIKQVQKGVTEHVAQMKAYDVHSDIICPVCRKADTIKYRYDSDASSMVEPCLEFWCTCGASWYSYFVFSHISEITCDAYTYDTDDNTVIDEREDT